MAVPTLVFHLILIFLIGRPKELQNLGMSSGNQLLIVSSGILANRFEDFLTLSRKLVRMVFGTSETGSNFVR